MRRDRIIPPMATTKKPTLDVPDPERKAAARALFETVPDIKFSEISEQVGVPVAKVRQWRQEDADAGDLWKLAHDWGKGGDASKRAKEAAALKPVLAATQAEAEAEARAVVEFAAPPHAYVDPVAELRGKHQKEWLGPRALAYQAMKMGQTGRIDEAFTLAKLAKISAETLTLIQQGELRAHNVKPGEGDGTLVLIERTGDGA